MGKTDLSWAVPVMRAGYAGRGIVYLVVAGFSLYAIWRGGQAKGTQSALHQLETTTGGYAILTLIFLGRLAYALWRVVAAFYDLECRGNEAKGLIARAGMIVTGLLHLSIGFLAFSLVFTSGGSGGSSIPSWVASIMALPGGRWIIAGAGLVIIGAGLHYALKGWQEKYREFLAANHFTLHWNPALKAGLIAQGAVIAVIGLLFVFAAWNANPSEAGGVEEAFSWLTHQPYGWALMAVICVGLLGFSLFCFVNAAYRIVPRVTGDDIETLAARLQAKARQATS